MSRHSDMEHKSPVEDAHESLRALIQAIIPEARSPSDEKLSGDAVTRLTGKLAELMGPEATQTLMGNYNERGELVNEDGLPIVDITEPDPDDMRTRSIPPPITVEPLIPLANLPAATRERLREKRNRILDLLEEEEKQAEAQEARRESQEKEKILRKHKEEAARKQDKLKEARELQKKLGRALLQNIGKAKEKEEKEKEAQRVRDEEADQRKSPFVKKKTVAFVETPEEDGKEVEDKSINTIDWGDLTLGRLQTTKRPTLMSQSLHDKHPMKMSVVERFPGGQSSQPKGSLSPERHARDSDDESEPEIEAESVDENFSTDEVLEQDEVDFDFAQHQREIALEYYRKRGTIGQDAAAAMINYDHNLNEQDVDAEGTREPLKPAVSQFRANRLVAAYGASTPKSENSASSSLAAPVIPESVTRTIQRAVKTGTLDDDGRLVGAEADSASEDEDIAMQEVLELLRKGEVYNFGPEGTYLHTVAPQGSSTALQCPISGSISERDVAPRSTGDIPPPSLRSKTSRFKASRDAAGIPPTSSKASIPSVKAPEHRLPSIIPMPQIGKPPPELYTPTTMAPGVAERKPFNVQSPVLSSPAFSTIVDSPSFPIPQNLQSPSDSRPSIDTTPQMTRASPSSLPLRSSTRPDRPPTVMASTVRESKAASSLASPTSVHATTTNSPSPFTKNTRRPERPPAVIAASVQEAIPVTSTRPAGIFPKSGSETSRFKADI